LCVAISFSAGRETYIYCCCASETKIESTELFTSELGRIVGWFQELLPEEVYKQKEEEKMH